MAKKKTKKHKPIDTKKVNLEDAFNIDVSEMNLSWDDVSEGILNIYSDVDVHKSIVNRLIEIAEDDTTKSKLDGAFVSYDSILTRLKDVESNAGEIPKGMVNDNDVDDVFNYLDKAQQVMDLTEDLLGITSHLFQSTIPDMDASEEVGKMLKDLVEVKKSFEEEKGSNNGN